MSRVDAQKKIMSGVSTVKDKSMKQIYDWACSIYYMGLNDGLKENEFEDAIILDEDTARRMGLDISML